MTTLSARGYIKAIIPAVSGNRACGSEPAQNNFCYGNVSPNAYVFTFSATSANTVLWKRAASSNTDLNTSCGADNQFATGDNVTLKVAGSFIQVYDGSSLVCSATDTSLLSGRAGVGLGSSPRDGGGDQQGQRLDNFLIYLFNKAPTTPTPEINSSNGADTADQNLNCSTNP